MPPALSPPVPLPDTWAQREGPCVLPDPLFPSHAATAQLLQPPALPSSPGLQCAALFIYLFFSWKTGLLQGILCSFPGSCPSRDLKNSRRMRCSHPEQCCTCGGCRCRSGYYLELYWGEEVRLIRADAAISHEGSIPTALALPNGMTFECITLLLLILEETDLGEKSRIHSCLKAGSATTTLKDDPATSLATFPMTYSSSPSELSS